VLVAGVSTRAIAESAARAGFAVTAIDAFADLDQHPSVRAESLGADFSPDAASRRAEGIVCDAVAYTSNFENHPDAVTRLARARALWGNPPDVLRRVRDPQTLRDALRRRGLASPEVVDGQSRLPIPQSGSGWLLKPRASGGGHRVAHWRGGTRLPRGCYLHEFIDGMPGSIVFVAGRRRGLPIGFSRQLIGDDAFGVSGFRYCGSILTGSGEDADAVAAARDVVAAICDAFDLAGVNGIDVVAKDGVLYPIEVNPRWCASMDLVERAYGWSVFAAHADACRGSALPAFDLASVRRGTAALGKAIVYARADVTVRDLRASTAAPAGDLRDIPRAGTRIRRGHPVCTVMATGADAVACRAELVRGAERVYAALEAML
jgi:predicted ATP-grasp superfamily ATP-dependent carboligase